MSLLTDASLLLTPNAYKEGKLYSVIPSNGNGDFTVTRATTATRVNSAGLVDLVPYNLFNYSEMFSDASWVKTRTLVTANTITAPNGTLTADTLTLASTPTSTTRSIQQSTNSTNLTNTASIYLKYSDRQFIQLVWGSVFSTTNYVNIDVLNGTITQGVYTNATIESVGSGWYRVSLTTIGISLTPFLYIWPIDNGTDLRAANSSGTGSYYIWGAQLVEGTSARDYLRTETRLNIPRIDYSLGGCPNILLEPQRTNVFLNSVFSGSGATPTSWTQPQATGTSTLTTSTLGSGAQACSQSATNQRPFLSQNFTLLANTTYSYSIYIESISNSLSNEQVLSVAGLPVGATISYFANGVSVSNSAFAVVGRLSLNVVVSAIGGSVAFRCGIGTLSNQTGTLLFSRPQLEAGAYATSYIPTTTASVTRNTDSITRNNIYTNGLITAAGGTWFVEFRNNRALIRDASSVDLFLGDTSAGTTNSFAFSGQGTSGRLRIGKRISAVFTQLYVTTTDTCKVAIKWNGSTMDIFENGVKVVNATSFPITNMEQFRSQSLGTPLYINQMALFPTPLTDAQCIALTQ